MPLKDTTLSCGLKWRLSKWKQRLSSLGLQSVRPQLETHGVFTLYKISLIES